ncbi:hypothetical protein [Pseudomonas petrae]|uniref:hypothetical protein n=1 Tax=Pseudomonas petrae TaxID=2912190 RepID=UPI001F193FAB|nr:hypothetical protein [Pseudomonas petrae]MCF7557729.1 hypothetical protein [Pseudomonas petrae]
MTHDDITMPAAVRQELDRLLASIKHSIQWRSRTSGPACCEGFVLGVDVSKALNAASIEALYLVGEQSVEIRVGELAAQA